MTTFFLLLAALFSLSVCLPVFAQQEREMSTLKMFYEEDDIVVTPTRYPKSISRVAENITVITADDIKAINAHTLADVLNYVPGVQVEIVGGPGSASNVFIQGSSTRHVLLMIDGVVQNNLSDFYPDVGAIPVQFIERVEIIKGPASSSWGSSLGGVINVITKDPEDTRHFGGMLSASVGERNTSDFRGEVSGKAGGIGYYLSGGGLLSDGLLDHNGYHGGNLYAKLKFSPTDRSNLSFSLGYNKGYREFGELPLYSVEYDGDFEYLFANFALNYLVTDNLSLDLGLRSIWRDNSFFQNLYGTGFSLSGINATERNYGATAKVAWTPRFHEVVFGLDFDSGLIDSFSIKDGEQRLEKWAVFLNDTFSFGKLSITPGIRYDSTNTSGDFWSPSLGVTYSPFENTILRTYIARGFNMPPLALTFGDGLFSVANSSLKMERVWSYSLGFETTVLRYAWLKTTIFRHEISDLLSGVLLPDGRFSYVNKDKQRRQGVEVEIKSMPLFNTSLTFGFTFTDAKDRVTENVIPLVARHTYDVGLQYDDKKGFIAILKGRYINWNGEPMDYGRDTAMIWDLNISKKVFAFNDEQQAAELFFSAHNLFNGAQYSAYPFRNPRRWFEGGVRFCF